MKVLLINNFHCIKGGTETVYFNTARLLRKAGHEVCFFSINREEVISTPFLKYFVNDPLSMSRFKGAIKYIYNKEAALKLQALIDEEKPDIAHAHLMWGCLAPAIFKVLKNNNIPLIHTAHDYRMVCPAYTFNSNGRICEECKGRHFYKCLLNKCSKNDFVLSFLMMVEMYHRNLFYNPAKYLSGVIYVSIFSHQKHCQYFPKLKNLPTLVLYNCSPKDIINSKEDMARYYLYYGRLSYEKGVDILIECFKSLQKSNLLIVGTGPEEESLKKLANGYSNINFAGFKKGEELKKIVREAYFVIVPSQWYENNPMTVIEAYSAGVPVIGSNQGGIPEIIKDGKTGFIFESSDTESLKNCIIKAETLNKSEYKKFSENSSDFFDINFSEERYSKMLIGFYEKVCKKSKKS